MKLRSRVSVLVFFSSWELKRSLLSIYWVSLSRFVGQLLRNISLCTKATVLLKLKYSVITNLSTQCVWTITSKAKIEHFLLRWSFTTLLNHEVAIWWGFFRLLAPTCTYPLCMAAGAVCLKKPHHIIILWFSEVVKGHAKFGSNFLCIRRTVR